MEQQMTTSGFARAMPRILAHEGGKVDDPRDPGGRTNQGVTQAVYSAYRKRLGSPVRDVYDMESYERDAIYKDQYWNAIQGNELPAGLDYVVFDGAVNSGCSRSAKWLQKALGVEQDGQIGNITLAALNGKDIAEVIDDICDIRMAFLKGLKTWSTFGRGWTARVSGVRAVGKAWANKEPVRVSPAQPTPKATKPHEPEAKGLWDRIASLWS